MKVIITRKDHICYFEGCCLGKVIRAKTISVTTVYKRTGIRNTFHFHPDCYTQWILNNKDLEVKKKEELLARRRVKSNKPQGRPRKYSDPLKARNLLSLIYYHKEAGNTDKVQELEYLLEGLRID